MNKLVLKTLISIWVAIIAIIYVITQRPKRQHTDNFFYNPNTIQTSNTIVTDRQQKLLDTQYALREWNITQAIHTIPTQTAKDLYNRWTLRTIQAYSLFQEKEYEQSQELRKEAQEDFLIAAETTNNIHLQKRIQDNYTINRMTHTASQVHICIDDFWTLLQDLTAISTQLGTIQESINDQLQYIQDTQETLTSNIGEECVQAITDTMQQTKQSLQTTKNTIQEQERKYQYIYADYLEQPEQCLNTEIKPLLRDTTETQSKLTQLQQTYNLTQQALETNQTNLLEQMCAQAQDDTLSNQETEQTLQQLLNNLEQSTQEQDQENENQAEPEPQEPNQNEEQSESSSSTPQYIPLTEEEETILQETYQINKQRLDTMMQIKKNNYNPIQSIETIFQTFYGDPSQFQIPWR